jgi:hypothetical protein
VGGVRDFLGDACEIYILTRACAASKSIPTFRHGR